jgi:hypothetical protein
MIEPRIPIEDIYRQFREQQESLNWRRELYANWPPKEDWEEMSNRKKIKEISVLGPEPNEFRARIAKIQNTFAGRYNAYTCDKCGKAYLTLDVDPGVTPMFSPCFATEGCDGRAHSAGYPNGEPPEEFGDAIIHWVRPTKEEMKGLSEPVRQHVEQGGLVRRPTEATPEWVRELL